MSLLAELGPRALGLGTAGFAFGSGSVERSLATVAAALDGGVRLIDTARAYTRAGEESTAETIVGAALRSAGGDRAIVATKGGHWRDRDSFPIDGRPSMLRRHVHDSLRILGVEQIDLYQLHHPDPAVPIEESVEVLRELQADGHIRHVGLSNVSLVELEAASRVAAIASVQNRLSVGRPVDSALLRACETSAIVFLAYSPLGGVGAAIPHAVEMAARRHGASPAQVMLAWLFSRSPVVVPIVGATRPDTVGDSMGSRTLRLSAGDLLDLDEDEGETADTV